MNSFNWVYFMFNLYNNINFVLFFKENYRSINSLQVTNYVAVIVRLDKEHFIFNLHYRIHPRSCNYPNNVVSNGSLNLLDDIHFKN